MTGETRLADKTPGDKAVIDEARTTPIDELATIELNGVSQGVLYRGNDWSKPVVLFVHGGPGYPLMWFSRAYDDAFINDFVVVHWDQRGAGKSASREILPESITMDQIVDDGVKLTRHLKQKFNTDKIIVVGHSWGTMVAANMATNSPNDFRALILVGTCADWKRGEEMRYARLMAIARESGDPTALDTLEAIGPPPYLDAARTLQFGDMIIRLQRFSGTSVKLSEDDLSAALLKTREYSQAEIAAAGSAVTKNLDLLSEFCNRYVLMQAVRRMDVPVVFIQGEHDDNTPTALAKEYFDALEAPRGKTWVLFEGCAHMALYEDRLRFLNVLKATMKQACSSNRG